MARLTVTLPRPFYLPEVANDRVMFRQPTTRLTRMRRFVLHHGLFMGCNRKTSDISIAGYKDWRRCCLGSLLVAVGQEGGLTTHNLNIAVYCNAQ